MTLTRHILLLRHGLTDANSSGITQGHQPTPLNALGRAQAQCLGRRMAQHEPRIQALISSDLARAAQTAEPVSKACNLPIHVDAAWRERGFGELEGKTAAERDIWRLAAGEVDPPGAEPADAFTDRVYDALVRAAADSSVDVVGIVTHGGPCRVILRMLIDGRLPLVDGAPKPELTTIANCSIMHLLCHRNSDQMRWELLRLNDVDHLCDMQTTARDAG